MIVEQQTKQRIRLRAAVGTLFLLLGIGALAAVALPRNNKPDSTLPPGAVVPGGHHLQKGSSLIPRSDRADFIPGQVLVKMDKNKDVVPTLSAVLQGQQLLFLDRLTGQRVKISESTARQNPLRYETRKITLRVEQIKKILARSEAIDQWYRVRLNHEADIDNVLERLKNSRDIEEAQPNYLLNVAQTPRNIPADDGIGGGKANLPNDPLYASTGSWGRPYGDLWGLKRLGMELVWPFTRNLGQVIIAVSDTGIDYNHEDLVGHIWSNSDEIPNNGVDDDQNGFIDDVRGYDFTTCDFWSESECLIPKEQNNNPIDHHGHGTHVAGTIGAVSDNGLGLPGVLWNVKLMPLKGLNDQGFGDSLDLAEGIIYAADNHATVLNMSWGGIGNMPVITEALQYAHDHGVVLVAAAGNEGGDMTNFFPASDSHVISVGAWCPSNFINRPGDHCDNQEAMGTRAKFSNFGDGLDLVAPGYDIVSARAEGTDMYGDGLHIVSDKYYRADGTSMAAPHVAALAGMIRSVLPEITPNQVEAILTGTADDLETNGRDISSGYGLINPTFAMQLAQNIQSNARPELKTIGGSVLWSIIKNGNNRARIVADIMNFGAQPAVNITYRGFLGNVNVSAVPVFEGVISALASGERTSVDFEINLASIPSQEVQIVIDPSNSISEYVETNNTFLLPRTYATPAGWPIVTANGGSANAPAIGEIDPAYPGLEIVASSQNRMVYAWHADGTAMNGWPKTLLGVGNSSSPVIADLDGDTKPEILMGSWWDDTSVFAWHADGTPVSGWPINVGSRVDSVPAVADIDPGYPGKEVVIGAGNSNIYAWHADGTPVSGWPRTEITWAIFVSQSVGNLDPSYPGLEVVAGGSFDNKVFAWHADGTPVAGWPKTGLTSSSNKGLGTTPAIADLDGNGGLEVVVGMSVEGKLYAWHADGTPVAGWPKITPYGQIQSSPAIGDFDRGYPGLEIAVGSTDGYHSAFIVYHADGSIMPGWPKVVYNDPSYSDMVMSDVDGDQQPELFTGTGGNGSNLTGLYGWRSNGSNLPGFPIKTYGALWSTPIIGDLNNDGLKEILIGAGTVESGSISGSIKVWSLSWWSSEKTPWPTFQHDTSHSGYYPLYRSSSGGGGIPRTIPEN